MVPTTGSIICGVDDSEAAKGAVGIAHTLAARLGRRIVLVRVVERGSPEKEIDATGEWLRRLAASEALADTETQWLVDVGHPADRLVAAAADEGASLLVLGSHGPRSSLLGSISAEVSRRAPCPVVVVPPGADAAVANGDVDTQLAGGIARFGFGGRDTDLAGGVVRLTTGAGDRARNW